MLPASFNRYKSANLYIIGQCPIAASGVYFIVISKMNKDYFSLQNFSEIIWKIKWGS